VDDQNGRVPTGMSNIQSIRSTTPIDDRTKSASPQEGLVYIPEAFKKTRKEKMDDQNSILVRL